MVPSFHGYYSHKRQRWNARAPCPPGQVQFSASFSANSSPTFCQVLKSNHGPAVKSRPCLSYHFRPAFFGRRALLSLRPARFEPQCSRKQSNHWSIRSVLFCPRRRRTHLRQFQGLWSPQETSGPQETNPLSPWLWRTDWASRRVEGANKKGYIGAWIAAAFCTLITAPFMLGLIPDLLRKSDPRVFILLGFNLFSAILIINAIRATIRHERFGNDYCEFDPLPISPGRRMTGKIQLRFETQAAHGIDLRLTCVRRIVTGSGKNQTTSKVTLWQADKNVPSGALEPGPLGRAIPVEFDVPADALITDQSNPGDQILWLLHAQADVPGVDYSDDFELPVFRTADSPQPAADSSSSSAQESFGRSTSNFGFATERSVDADSGAV